MDSIARFDSGALKGKAAITDEGYIKAEAIVTRTGVFLYRNPDGTIRRELRHPEDVLRADSLESMKLLPITNGHPPERLVNSKNAKKLAIGFTGETIKNDGQYLMTSLVITDEEGVKAVKMDGRKELSLGYTVDLVKETGIYEGQAYDYKQTNIKYNHLSIVDTARAGSMARIHLDALDAELITEEIEMEKQDKRSIQIDGVDYEIAEQVALHLDHASKQIEELKSKLDAKDQELIATQQQVETLKAEASEMQSKLDSQEDFNEKVKAAVKERSKLIDVAKAVLDGETLKTLDEMSNLELQKAIVKSKYPKANLDSASAEYIQSRFDALLEEMPEGSGQAFAQERLKMLEKHDSQKTRSSEDAYKELNERLKTSYIQK